MITRLLDIPPEPVHSITDTALPVALCIIVVFALLTACLLIIYALRKKA
ncbi:MAG: hypothetical protein J6Z41_03480 [Prevotella sp.]|nr:hypothetical protein [Prevotella sp.]